MERKKFKENLIFDMGNVLIGYRWKEMLTEDFGLSGTEAEEIGRQLFEDPIWDDFDGGHKEIDRVIEHYCDLYPEKSDVIKRFFYEGERMKVDRPRVWELVMKLKEQGHRIYVLSNYSEFLFKKHTEAVPFMDRLDGMVVSYEVRCLKPDPAIFRALIDKYDLDPKKCVFFDDLIRNVEAARSLGMEAVHVTDEEMLISYLAKGRVKREE